jgi:hypothetical protein
MTIRKRAMRTKLVDTAGSLPQPELTIGDDQRPLRDLNSKLAS